MRHRLDQAYLDKLDGKISEEFWMRKSAEWFAEEQQIKKPFDLIFARAKNEEWSALGDDFRTLNLTLCPNNWWEFVRQA